ncbi:4-hydroxy-tetrahydrodipicolinate reductase [Gramella sp. AN32]|uniref:4-hydroxy-tetrahydrodipicolinate reductase n=1 Tax=Christiangramia antarctica TaxID=2058158 RepID=A0ABW5X7F8_9FLAO|nr:4-hydroxy-tetrahydrodipicolinate reductase [Gramella sp. AN32]MCM4154437.1 4-hydroxy-tetrahydrodipicolinate reductase [Gramella sp. AN32]
MNIALLGYGKMGKTIEEIAINRGHEIVLKVEQDISNYKVEENKIDVAIDFSIPGAAFNNITTCFRKSIPVVCGTTGWLDHLDEAKEICLKNDSAFLYASNFSVGVNIFFELNKKLASMMQGMEDYSVNIEEIHHTQKLDAPSGTAITLANQIKEIGTHFKGWKLDKKEDHFIPIFAKREENVPGTHTVSYVSEIDSIEIKHTANSRLGFALGAVLAAEFLHNKKGIFSMKDVLSGLLQDNV